MNCPAATPNELSHTEYILKITRAIPSALKPINKVLQNKEPYEPIAVMGYTPGNQKQHYRYLYVCGVGIWSLCDCVTTSQIFDKQQVVDKH